MSDAPRCAPGLSRDKTYCPQRPSRCTDDPKEMRRKLNDVYQCSSDAAMQLRPYVATDINLLGVVVRMQSLSTRLEVSIG